MPFIFKEIDGLTQAQGIAGVNVSTFSGDGSAGPTSFVMIASASGLTPGLGSIQLFPGGQFTVGADVNGNISVLDSWLNSGDDIHFGDSHGAFGAFPDGAWNYIARVILGGDDHPIDIVITCGQLDPVATYNNDLVQTPDNPTTDSPSWDGSEGSVNLDWDYDNSLAEDPTAFAIYQDDIILASVPRSGTSYTYPVTVFSAGTHTYKIVAYKYPNHVSGFSAETSADFGGVPTLELDMSGGFSLGGSFVFNFLVDPSGIYKLVSGLTHDTLYNREDPLDIITVDVAIPDTFIETFFTGK